MRLVEILRGLIFECRLFQQCSLGIQAAASCQTDHPGELASVTAAHLRTSTTTTTATSARSSVGLTLQVFLAFRFDSLLTKLTGWPVITKP